ncbi:hypothetical protein FS837_003063 [Tulasnella sp. UAMH 9824]|nr:hypothetical protein FS837_003063 [Tulasnella sp. UAMH 9824]
MASLRPSSKHRRFGSEEPIEGEDIDISRLDRVASPASESDDDDAPPEAVSLGAGKEQVAQRDRIIRERDLNAARQRKEANKAKAAELKARKEARESARSKHNVLNKDKKISKAEAGRNVGNGDDNPPDKSAEDAMDSEPVDHTALARMQRAMAQAESEDEADGEGSWGGVQDPIPPRPSRSKAKKIPDRLPDSIFQAARIAAEREEEKSDDDMSSESQPDSEDAFDRAGTRPRKARHPGGGPKDVIVGSRTVRSLATTKRLGQHVSLQRPQAAREFRNKSLNVDGQIEHKPWQRVESQDYRNFLISTTELTTTLLAAHLVVRGKRLAPARNFAQAHRLKT